ncbi:proline racemase family protein [Urechidicola vernalis]|uniref:Proline racemase family protein n=1 Tax=Urechidicola vernalis TaxID=3075600 RepID=A0ABU2Y4F7_9FLAO|nr:proline racemase family protein [Urechidicola sp. P050]MDT0552942.1 proline racemase family protein [Urechidicola sp. P050]
MNKTYQNILQKTTLNMAKDWLQIKTIDMHTGGEPLRVILDGFPELKGNSVLDYRRYCKDNFDELRTALMFEPRGHADMYGCILTPPNDDEGDFGIIFLHNEGYSTMCGHAIIAISTLAIQMNWIAIKEGENILKIDAPCGRITSFANVENGKVTGVKFHCVPSFVVGLDYKTNIEGIGEVIYDLAYGGAFYAYVDMAKNKFDFDLSPASYKNLIKTGMDIKHAVMESNSEINHPIEDDLSFLYGTIFIDNTKQNSGSDSRNVCIFAEGEVDRCPTGSGVSGRMAIHKAQNEINIGETMTIESITDSVFKGSVISEIDYGPFKAVIPQVEGTAHITGTHTFAIDPNDPMKNGFILR